MSAHVQLRVHGVGDIVVQRWHTDRRDVLCESLRRLCTPHKRWRGRLHQLSGERIDVSTYVQLGVHGIRDVIL